jgi:uncharacterized protein with PIN domain
MTMKDKLDRKIDEAVGLTRRRRDRRDPVIGLKAPHRTGDPFTARLFENEYTAPDGRILEQPVRPGAPPIPPEGPASAAATPGQDVLVSPEGEPVPGVDTPEELPDEPEVEPEGEPDPDTQIEEQKRALFNTLSELIDLGRIERSEADIRQYVEEHEDEIGDLLDVLDDVIEMLIMDAEIEREPKTFDDEDDEVESTPGQKDYDELKPGVGSQVPRGGTTTTVIASDQSKPVGQKLSEDLAISRLMSGDDVGAVLDAAVGEEVVELNFQSEQDRDQALARMEKVDVPSTNLMKIGPDRLQVVRDDRNRADVEQQMNALENLEFTQSVQGQEEPAEVEEQYGAWGGPGEDRTGLDIWDRTDGYEELDPASDDEIGAMTEVWQELAFEQGDEAGEVLDMIDQQGPEATLDHLAEMGYTDMEGETTNDAPWGEEDEVYHDKESGLTLSWNSRLGYWGLQRKIESASEEPIGTTEAKKKYAEDPAEREKECPHTHGAWSGRAPNTGTFKCTMCGTELDPKTKKPIGESVNEQVNVSRTGLAVQVGFTNDAQAAAAKGALLQYKGIDVVIEADDHNIVVFTTDQDPEEARKRIEVILSNARLPMEAEEVKSLKMEIFEAGEEPLGFRYGGADLLPTPLPVGHGSSGADEDITSHGASTRAWGFMWTASTPEEAEQFVEYLKEKFPVYDTLMTGGKPNPRVVWLTIDNLNLRIYNKEEADALAERLIREFKSNDIEVTEVAEMNEQRIGPDLGRCPRCGKSLNQYDIKMGKCASCFKELPQAAAAVAPAEPVQAGAMLGAEEGVEEQAGPVATPDEQKYLVPFHAPDEAEPSPEGEPVETPPEEPQATADVLWRMDVPESNEEYQRLEKVLDLAKDQGLIVNWQYVPPEEEELAEPEGPAAEPPPPDDMAPSAEPVSEYRWLNGDDRVNEDWEDHGEYGSNSPDLIDPVPPSGAPDPESLPEPLPGDVGAFIAVEFAPETDQIEREEFAEWIEQETGDEAAGVAGIQISGWEQLIANETGELGMGELEPGVEPPAEEIVEPVTEPVEPAALAHGPTGVVGATEQRGGELYGKHDPVGKHQIKHFTKGAGKGAKIPWGQQQEPEPEDLFGNGEQSDIDWEERSADGLPAELKKMLADYQAAKQTNPQQAASLASQLKFEMGTLGLNPKDFGITEEDDEEDVPPEPSMSEDPFDQAYEPAVRQTTGGGAEPAGEGCPTPGRRIRSRGRGRGLARGKGRGPIGRPSKA